MKADGCTPILVETSMKSKDQIRILNVLLLIILFCIGVTRAYADDVVEKSDRILGIAVNGAKNVKFGKAFKEAQKSGFDNVQISAHWNKMEKRRGKYDNKYFVNANKLYSSNNIKVGLNLNLINTNRYIVPKYLKNKSIDHPDIIASFKNFADHIIELLKDCESAYISIGNEVDSYLVGDSRKWREFNELYKQAFHHIKAKYPHVPVGVKVTYDGMIGPSRRFVREINQETDLVLVTYYHIDWTIPSVREPAEIEDIFDEVTSLYPDKVVFFSEIGYPSSSYLNGSYEAQSEFVRQSFRAWDKHADQIKMLHFFIELST